MKRTRLNKIRKTPISKLKRELMALVKTYVKMRDNFTCQHCKQRVYGINCHVSHVVPVSHGNRLAFDPINMKVLCYHCHLWFWHKNPVDSGQWFQSNFPDRWEYLREAKHQIVKYKEEDYLIKIAQIKKLITNH